MHGKQHWVSQGIEAAASAAALLAEENHRLLQMDGFYRVNGARTLIANAFVSGVGIEVGGGNRPFPVGENAKVSYGDIRDADELDTYFKTDVPENGFIDAETFETINPESLDFILSAHVIEHLKNPFGSILRGLDRLKAGGVYVIVIPDKRFTFDRNRPLTTYEHLMRDLESGGEDTMQEAYLEHIRYVHTQFHPPIPAEDEQAELAKILAAKMDCHVHCWTRESFSEQVTMLLSGKPATIVFESNVENEAAFVIRKLG